MGCIYYGGKIITMEEASGADASAFAPEAVYVEAGKIAAVGTMEQIVKTAGSGAEMFDLKGACLMPAFIDSHGHIVMNGQMSLCANLSECDSYEAIIAALRSYKDERCVTQAGIIMGFGYDHNFLKEGGQPDRRVLDQVSKDIPILILHVSGHLACVNSAALDLAGINAQTQNPPGGMIGRLDGTSEPSGYLEETAISMVRMAAAKRIDFDYLSVVQGMQESYIRNGVTTVQDGAATGNDLQLLKLANEAGMLKIDVVAYPLMSAGGEALMRANMDMNRQYCRHLKIGGYKLVLDGSPQGRSAWMTKPYLGGKPDYCGYPWMSNTEVEKFVMTAVRERQQLLAHCNGDAAGDQYLNAYEKAVEKTGVQDDLRPVMIHCQTVRNDQLDRMAKLRMIASIFVGHVWFWGNVHMKNLGPERGNHISPVKDALTRGVTVDFHQDTPVTPPDMLHSIWCAVNRISKSGTVIGPEQKISVYEALKAVTIDAAYGYFEDDTKGSIKVGKRADFVILSDSPLDVEVMEIKNIKVLSTIKDGVVIYSNPVLAI